MIGALLYLRLTSLKNWLLSRVRRLRQPKYLVGAIVGGLYFWFFFFRRFGSQGLVMSNHPGRAPLPNMPDMQMMPMVFMLAGLGVVMLLRIGAAWLAPGGRPGIMFTEAEVAFLFPAPISRHALVHYRLISTQVTILLSSLLLTLVSGRGAGGNALTHSLGWWIMLSMVNLHTVGAAFTVTRLTDGGVSRRRRQAVVIAVIAVLLGAVGYGIWQTAPTLQVQEMASVTGLMGYVRRLADTGVLHWVLLPIRLVLGPFLATGWREFLFALGPALLLLAAHYLWVLRAETSFEEASIALAEKRAALVASIQAGKYRLGQAQTKARRGPFRLAPAGGRPEIAFLWKNLLSTRPYFNHRVFLVCAGLILAGHAWLAQGGDLQRAGAGIAGAFALMLGAYTLLLGPQFARQDLRSDLSHADVLKTYPLRGWQVVLGELLAPAAILTGILWLALLTAALGLGAMRSPSAWLAPGFRATAALCLAVVVPLLCLLQLMVPNAATLLFPSWAQTTRTRDRGIDVMGQRLIFVAGQMLVILLALLPAAVLGLLLWFAAHWLLDEAGSTAVATAGVAGVLLTEAGLGLLWLGRRFERFDLSNEILK